MSVETTDYLAMLRRMIAAGGKRVAEADEVELAELVALFDDLEAAVQLAVDGQREHGASWARIGDALGVTRQAAQMRWGKREVPATIVCTRCWTSWREGEQHVCKAAAS